MTLKNPLDMHLHLRDGAMLELVAPFSASHFRAAVIMPNLVPPLTEIDTLKTYKERILRACGVNSSSNLSPNSNVNLNTNSSPNFNSNSSTSSNFTPLMTLFFKPYSREFLEKAREHIFAIKLYPADITTNSSGGVSSFDLNALAPTLEAMSDLEIPLLVHGETNDFVLDREAKFAPIYSALATRFKQLKIVMEHISTKALCELLKEHENLYATATLHHLMLTLDDVIGGKMSPHLFCKPIAKRIEDKDALCELAFNGFDKLMFGSDSAPHPKSEKECCGCAAGIFSAPVALSLLASLFERHSTQENLQKFISDNACKIYNFKFTNNKIIHLEKRPWQVPQNYGSVVPFMAGETLEFKVCE